MGAAGAAGAEDVEGALSLLTATGAPLTSPCSARAGQTSTAVAFGVTGVLWAMHPLLAVNDELTGQRRLASGLLTALLGCVMLVGWSLLGTH